jgi:hypothetical protein
MSFDYHLGNRMVKRKWRLNGSDYLISRLVIEENIKLFGIP